MRTFCFILIALLLGIGQDPVRDAVRDAAPDAATSQLSAAEAGAIAQAAAGAVADARMAIAVVDRAGRPLAIYRKAATTDDAVEEALSVARTSAFFSHNQAPLSSRTVGYISQEHFPVGIPNQPAGALYGIEHSNRGCDYRTSFIPGQEVPRWKNWSKAD